MTQDTLILNYSEGFATNKIYPCGEGRPRRKPIVALKRKKPWEKSGAGHTGPCADPIREVEALFQRLEL